MCAIAVNCEWYVRIDGPNSHETNALKSVEVQKWQFNVVIEVHTGHSNNRATRSESKREFFIESCGTHIKWPEWPKAWLNRNLGRAYITHMCGLEIKTIEQMPLNSNKNRQTQIYLYTSLNMVERASARMHTSPAKANGEEKGLCHSAWAAPDANAS